MNSLIRFILFLLSIGLFYSCYSKKKLDPHNKQFEGFELISKNATELKRINSNVKVYSIPDSAKPIFLDSLLGTIKYLKLETNPNCLIGKIDKILFLKDRLIIVDKEVSKSVFIFDTTGRFLHKIYAYGKGINEYSTISNVAIDINDKTIIVFDNKLSKLFYFDLKGAFLKIEKVGLRFRDFVKLDSNTFLLFTQNLQNDHEPSLEYYSLMVLKNNNEIINKDFYINPLHENIELFAKDHITTSDSNIFFFPRLSDTVYQIYKDGSMSPVYSFQYKNFIPREFFEVEDMNDKIFRNKIKEKGYSYFLGHFYESNSHIITTLNVERPDKRTNIICINKNNNAVLNISETARPTKNNIFSFPGYSLPLAVKDNNFFGVLYPTNLLQLGSYEEMTKKYKFKFTEDMQELFVSLKKNDNPILMIYTLQNF